MYDKYDLKKKYCKKLVHFKNINKYTKISLLEKNNIISIIFV